MGSEKGLFAQHNELIGSAVHVESADLTFTTGVLYCIDPESDSVVLLNACEDESGSVSEWSVKIFLSHSVFAIRAADQQNANATLESIQQRLRMKQGVMQQGVIVDTDALLRRREQLCAFLGQRFIPCEDSDSFAAGISVFGGAARVLAPFTAASIECVNEQILARLQQLLVQFDSSISEYL